MEAWENECETPLNDILHMKVFASFTSVFTFFVKFDIHFLRFPWEIFLGVITYN